MGWLPAANVLVVQVAPPFVSATAEHPPMDVLPSRKFIVPVGVPLVPLAVAVKVTLCPAVAGFAELNKDTDAVALVPPTENVYDTTFPTSGLLCEPTPMGASCPSTANA